jgi:CheY-like chemotaxis protein
MISTTFDRHVVLIVDDMPDNLAMLSDALDESGHIVLVATDGLAALQRLDHITPDLILLDAMMPGIDGFETCRRIKQTRGEPRAGGVHDRLVGDRTCGARLRGRRHRLRDQADPPAGSGGTHRRAHPHRAHDVADARDAGTGGACGDRWAAMAADVADPQGFAVAGKILWRPAAPASHKLPGPLQVWLNEQLVRQRQGESLDVPLVVRQRQDELHITWPALARGMA